MRTRAILEALGSLLFILSLVLLFPVVVGIICGETTDTLFIYFFMPSGICISFGVILWFLGARILKKLSLLVAGLDFSMLFLILYSFYEKYFTYVTFLLVPLFIILILYIIGTYFKPSEKLHESDAIYVVGIGWLIIAFFCALPYMMSTLLPPVDSYFESMSGICTCGASVVSNIENFPRSLVFWRAFSQWMGGLGFILLSVIFLTKYLGAGSVKLFGAELSKIAPTRLTPRIKQTATIIGKIYLLLTFIGIILLIAAGLPIFDSVTHTFTSIATGGFSIHSQSIGHYRNLYVDLIVISLMILGATPFFIHYKFFHNIKSKNWKGLGNILHDVEFKFYISSILIFTLIITAILVLNNTYNLSDALRYGGFQITSIHTASGFFTTDFGIWPFSTQLILLLLMFVGGCAGSTAGGLKIMRIIIIGKLIRNELRKIVNPRRVLSVKISDKPISDETIKMGASFVFIYLFTFVLISVVITLTDNLDVVSATSPTITSLSGVGPGLGAFSPAYTFANLTPVGKVLLSIAMWLGRLEIFTAIIIFLPETYRR